MDVIAEKATKKTKKSEKNRAAARRETARQNAAERRALRMNSEPGPRAPRGSRVVRPPPRGPLSRRVKENAGKRKENEQLNRELERMGVTLAGEEREAARRGIDELAEGLGSLRFGAPQAQAQRVEQPFQAAPLAPFSFGVSRFGSPAAQAAARRDSMDDLDKMFSGMKMHEKRGGRSRRRSRGRR
jgi:hypothetical protein